MVLAFISSVFLGKSLHLFGSQFSHESKEMVIVAVPQKMVETQWTIRYKDG